MTELHRTDVSDTRIGAEMVGIEAGTPVELDVRLESVSEGVLVTGTVRAETSGQCARCLDPITGEVNLFLTELFAYPDSETDQTTDDEDVERIVDEQVALEQTIIDAVATTLPLSPLCREDCPGLCPECGVKLADAGPDHGHDLIDPRWAGLAKFAGETPEADGQGKA